MMELDLDDFAAAVAARAPAFPEAAVQWQLHHGPTSQQVFCLGRLHYHALLAQLVVWTSGEAELSVGDISTGAISITNYQMSNIAELTACLDDLTSRLMPPSTEA